MPVAGEGRRGILVVSEYPGPTEDERGEPLVGRAGQYAAEVFASVGIDLRRDCWLTNAQICHDIAKAHPPTAVEDCRPNLLKTLRDLDPHVIVLMGQTAVESLIGHLWKEDVGSINKWVGRCIPAHKPNAWVIPTNNPAYLLRDKLVADQVLKAQFRGSLRTASQLTSRPHPNGPPDYTTRVERIKSPQLAAERLKRITSGTVAIDYEANALKPEAPGFEIVCCAVSNGAETIAYPWHGAAVGETKRLLADPRVGKIASNLKYEHRVSSRILGVEVVNWVHDTMLAAHCLDPRPGGTGRSDQTPRGSGTTGLKYLAFVHLGMPDYNGHLEGFLQSEGGGNSLNRIKELNRDTVLLYCGLDALLEYEVALIQAHQMGLQWPDAN